MVVPEAVGGGMVHKMSLQVLKVLFPKHAICLMRLLLMTYVCTMKEYNIYTK